MQLRGRYLQELGVKYETVNFDLSKQEHKAEAYLKVGHCLLALSCRTNTILAFCRCNKVQVYLVVACCGQLVDVDMVACRTKRIRTVAQINPYGKVPALQDGNLTLVRCSSWSPFGQRVI